MGTSQSSPGAPSGVPLVPPWVPEPVQPDEQDSQNGADEQDRNDQDRTAPIPQPDLAPRGRFGPARRNLGQFAQSGSSDDMRRGVGHYIGKGLGGSSSAARRFSGTAQTAGALYGALSSPDTGRPSAPGSPLDPALMSGRSVDEVMDAVVEAVRPIDGTQDTESSRDAIRTALSELLERFPGTDLLNLSEDQRLFAIQQYLALDVYNHLSLDVGKVVHDRAPSASAALSRLREIREYVREVIAASFRRLRAAGETMSARRIAQMGAQALRAAFDVFEEYVR
jgi:hypothetical protein